MGKDAVAAFVALGFASFAICTDIVGIGTVLAAHDRGAGKLSGADACYAICALAAKSG